MKLAWSLPEMQVDENWHVVYLKCRHMKLACSLQEMQVDETGR